MRIFALDQVRLPISLPSLERCFALNRDVDIVVDLVPDEQEDFIFRGKLARFAAAMLLDATAQIVGHADVQSAIFSAREQIHEVDVVAHGLVSLLA